MRWWHVGLVVLACVIVYSNTFTNGFHLDDAYRVEDNPGVQRFWPPWRHFVDETTSAHLPRLVQYRPMLPLSLSINYAIAGDSLVGYHIGNLLFHLVASVLVYFFARELIEHWSGLAIPPHAPLFVALLFAVHPVSGVPVNYICSRDLLMMQLFAVGALLCYVRMRRIGETPLRWGACLLLLLLAVLSKKNAVMIPGLVALFELLFTKGSLARLWRAAVMAGVVGLLLLYVRFGLGFSDYGNVVAAADRWEYAAHQLQHHVFHYLRNFVWPFPIRQSAVDPIAGWKMVIGGLCVLTSWGLAVYWWRRRPLLTLCVLGYQAWIALTSSVVPLFDEIVAYRPYPSSVFLFLGLVVLIGRAPVVLAAAVVYLGCASFWLNSTWKDDRSLWEHSVAHGASSRGYYNLAQALPDDDPAKRGHYEKALSLEPGYIVGHIGFAMFQVREGVRKPDAGDIDAGLARLDHAVSLGPGRAQTHYWRAQALLHVEHHQDAADAAKKAWELQPGNARYQYFAGQRASVAGRFAEVVRILEPLHTRTGGFEHSGFLIGYAYYKLQDWPKAIRYLEDFLVRNPSFWREHRTLAACYRAAGDHESAARHQKIYDSKKGN